MSKITRRDFINGTLMVAGASMLPFGRTSGAILDKLYPLYYPPSLTGLRGSHPGSKTTKLTNEKCMLNSILFFTIHTG